MAQKFFSFIAGLLFTVIAYTQIPAGYYDAASSKTGETLRAALRDIITAGSVKLPYTSSSFDVWDAYAVTDTRPGNNTIIWDMYSDIPSGNPLYTFTLYTKQCGTSGAEGDCYSREHQVPNSWWGGLDDPQNPQYTDLHHLPPADQYVNNRKSAHPIGQVTIPSWTSTNGSKVGPCSWPGYTGTVFEPIDEYKGDFARAYLYVATRYMNSLRSWVTNYPGTEAQYVIDTSGKYKEWFVDMLIQWCNNDPVSQKEMDRNDAIYYNTPQHNRNPYIDHPEYVCLVWSSVSCTAAPFIASISQNPASPGSLNTVAVTATINSTNPISAVSLDWGTDGTSFPNTIVMNPATGNDYMTASSIPAQLTGTTVYYKVTVQDNLNNTTTSSVHSYTVLKGEPGNYPVNFACGTVSGSSISLNWIDATGPTLPDGYLVKASTISLAAIADPVNGMPEVNGSFTKNIPAGTQQVSFTGLSSSTNYYFKIYSYTNSGANINYKTTPAAPNTSCTTAVSTGGLCATDLIISEYVEGSSSNKYIELYNSTGAAIDLSNYRLRLFSNGSATATTDVLLSGTLNDLSTIVYKNSGAVLYTGPTVNNGAVNFNGDDAIALYKISTASYVDIVGRIGERPTPAWTSGVFSTIDKTLVRNANITAGVTTNPAAGFPTLSTEWTQYNTDVVSNLGSHTMTCASCASPSLTASNISFSATGQTTMTINWTNGNGSKRIVAVSDGNAVSGIPANGITYTANTVFGSGDILNAGEYIVYNNSGSSVSITNLSGGHTYFITVYEYNCVPGSQIYLSPGTSASKTTYSITTGTVPESQYCITAATGFTTTVDFSSTGVFSSNTYKVQLSDANGSFALPVEIGSLVSNLNSETISCTIPANTVSGTGYMVRVVSSNPVITGTNSNPFEIILSPVAIAPTSVSSDRSGFCSTDPGTISLTATGGSGTILSWYSGGCAGTFIGTGNPLVIASPISTTTYYARWDNTCSSSACTSVTVSVSGIPAASAGAAISSCSGQAAITMTGASSSGAVNTWSGGSGMGTWIQNSNPALATFTPSVPGGSFIATLTVFSTSGCTDLSATYTRKISWGTAGTWTGAYSTDWFTASNWCGGVPTSSTFVSIPPTSNVLFSPVINNSFATCQNITVFGLLDFGNGFNLDVYGNWVNNGGSLNGSTGSVSFRGTNKIIAGTTATNFPGIRIIAGATVSMNNSNTCTSLSFPGGSSQASLTFTGTSSLTVNGNVTINHPLNSGTSSWNINNGSATVIGNLTIGSGTSNSSRITKVALINGSLSVSGNLIFSAGIASSSVVDLSGGTASLNLAGAVTRNSTGTILPGTQSTVNYNGSISAQTVAIGNGITYNNLVFNNTNPSGVLLGAAITSTNVTGNMTVQSGYFGNGGFAINGNITKQFSVVNNATFRLTANSSVPTGFSNIILGNSSTVEYNGSLTQTIAALDYGNLYSSGLGARTLASSGTIGIAGAFTPGTNAYTVIGSTINFKGANQTIPVFNGQSGYNNLYITQSTGTALAGGNITVGGNLNLVSGNFNIGSNVLLLAGPSAISGAPFSATKMIIADGGGELRKNFSSNGSYLFPVGDNLGIPEYAPVTVNFTSGTYGSGAYASVSVNNIKHPSNANNNNFLNRYWTVINSGITSPVYNIDASYVLADITGSDLNISMARFSTALPWIKYNPANSIAKTLSATGLTNTGSSAFSGISSTGPVISIQGGGISICNGDIVQLSATATGTAPFTYAWSPPASLNQAAISNPLASPVTATTYTLTVTDANGFIATANTSITVNPLPAVSFSGLLSTFCSTDVAVNLTGTPSGGIFTGPGITGNTFNPSAAGAGTHSITYTYTNGNGCSNTSSQQVTVTGCINFATLNLKLYLEGSYEGSGMMRATKFDLGLSTDPTATDDITVNLWSVSNLSNSNPDYTGNSLLHTNGTATVQFPAAVNGNTFYIAIRHRNSLETWSKLPVTFTLNTDYDFSTGLEKAYDDAVNPSMATMGAGIYAIYSGDVDQNGGIDASDVALIDNDNSIFAFGYNASDLTGDGGTDASDLAIADNNMQLFLFYARPF